MARQTFVLLRTRPIGIGDISFALRRKGAKKSSLEQFEEAGMVIDLKPEWEAAFVEFLVKTHPCDKKDFEHALISPPKNIRPSRIRKELAVRSPMIPTLYVVYLIDKIPKQVQMISDHYELLSLIADAKEDGILS